MRAQPDFVSVADYRDALRQRDEARADLDKALAALERVAEKCEGDPRNQEPEAVARFIRATLSELDVGDRREGEAG